MIDTSWFPGFLATKTPIHNISGCNQNLTYDRLDSFCYAYTKFNQFEDLDSKIKYLKLAKIFEVPKNRYFQDFFWKKPIEKSFY